ncbi:MAG: MBL fold metallo-hydrolase [Acidobacteria bacterium]|nr:MBL fold metallo-hydrolase [Acidobacteriota bacterium]MCB9397778.1 MBL fold metallo-hydrolase [Acidobacteriota bacterium]
MRQNFYFFCLLMITSLAYSQETIKVHRFVGGLESYESNAFWLEGPQHLVLIDSLMLKADAEQLVAAMKTAKKPLAGIIITHPHLDHFGGIRTVLAGFGSVPVIATQATASAMPIIHEQALSSWAKALGDRYETNLFVPNQLTKSGETLEIGGLKFRIHDYGPMESENNSVVENLDLKVLFTGDATVAHAPYYVGEGHIDGAQAGLERLTRDFPPEMLCFSGHYAPLPLGQLVKMNLAEIHSAVQLVEDHLHQQQVTKNEDLTRELQLEMVERIQNLYDARTTFSYGLSNRTMAMINLPGLIQWVMNQKSKNIPGQ